MGFECEFCNIITSTLKISRILHSEENQNLCDFCGTLTCSDHIIEILEGDGIDELTTASLDDVCSDCYLYKFCDITLLE